MTDIVKQIRSTPIDTILSPIATTGIPVPSLDEAKDTTPSLSNTALLLGGGAFLLALAAAKG